jgi:hypothetical protein
MPNFNLTKDDEVNLINVSTNTIGIPNGITPNSSNINKLMTKITTFINDNLDQYVDCNINRAVTNAKNDTISNNNIYFNQIETKLKVGIICVIVALVIIFVTNILTFLKIF